MISWIEVTENLAWSLPAPSEVPYRGVSTHRQHPGPNSWPAVSFCSHQCQVYRPCINPHVLLKCTYCPIQKYLSIWVFLPQWIWKILFKEVNKNIAVYELKPFFTLSSFLQVTKLLNKWIKSSFMSHCGNCYGNSQNGPKWLVIIDDVPAVRARRSKPKIKGFQGRKLSIRSCPWVQNFRI